MSRSSLNTKKDMDVTFLSAASGEHIKSIGTGPADLKNLAEKLNDDLADEKGNSIAIIDRSKISIPSPWASFLTFVNMLFDNNDKKTIEEWKSLILLIGLKPIVDLNISYVDINLKSDKLNKNAKGFADNILAVTPDISLFGDGPIEVENAWKTIRLIKIENYVVGALSNLTLVCSPSEGLNSELASYFENKNYPQIIKYNSKGVEFDYSGILEVFFKNAGGKDNALKCCYILEWLTSFRKRIMDIGNIGRGKQVEGYCSKIAALFADIIKDIKELIEKENMASQLENYSGFVRFESTLGEIIACKNVREFFDNVNITVDFSIDAIKNKILVDKLKVVSFKNLDEELVKIFESDEISNKIMPQNAQLLRKEDIFLPTITVLELISRNWVEHLTPCSENKELGIMHCPLAPIKQKAMEKYFSHNPYALKKSLVCTGTDDITAIKVELNFKTVEGTPIKLSETYSGEQIKTLSINDIPMIGIWPYMDMYKLQDGEKQPLWKKYFIYSSTYTGENRSNNIVEFKSNVPCKKIYSFEKANTAEGGSSGIDRVRQITVHDELPKYFSVFERVSSSRIQEKGTLLLDEPEDCAAIHEGCKIGFDFGTTSTTAFCKRPADDEPSFIKLGKFFTYDHTDDNRINVDREDEGKLISGLLQVTKNHLLSTEQDSDYGVFFPADKLYKRQAYPSIFADSSLTRRAGLYEFFGYGSAVVSYCHSHIPKGMTEIDDDMKWSISGDDNKRDKHMGGYIAQVLSQIMYNIIFSKRISGTVELNVSYPTAMSYTLEKGYRNCIRNVVNYINDNILVSENIKIEEPTYEKSYKTESIAAALNFMDKGGSFYACVDIGGGSSDISAWTKDEKGIKNIMQTSINVASRDIFRPAFSELIIKSSLNPDETSLLQKAVGTYIGAHFENILKKSIKEYESSESAKSKRAAIEKVAGVVESVLFEHSDALRGYISGDTNEFNRKILFGLYSILYFTIYSITYKMEEAGELDEGAKYRDLNIFLAGNGSKLYTWIDPADLKKLGAYLTKLARGCGIIDEEIGEVIINEPDFVSLKTEAARGLLNDLAGKIDKIEKDMIFNGEIIEFERKDKGIDIIEPNCDLKANEKIMAYFEENSDTIYTRPKLNDQSMDNIKSLVEDFNSEILDPSIAINKEGKEKELRFWGDVSNSAEEILIDEIRRKQMSSTLMLYVKAVMQNI